MTIEQRLWDYRFKQSIIPNIPTKFAQKESMMIKNIIMTPSIFKKLPKKENFMNNMLPSIYHEAKNKELLDFENRYSELECSPASLRGHIANIHFAPDIMALIGVPRYDIDLAKHRGFRLEWVVRQVYKRLEESSETVMRRFFTLIPFPYQTKAYFEQGDVVGYKEMLVKTLRYIEEQGLASISWDRVALSVPTFDGIVLAIDRDSADKPFVAWRNLIVAIK